MNRRSFFQSLATVGSGLLVAPSLFIPKQEDRFKWRNPRWIINPEWIDAPYEFHYIGTQSFYMSFGENLQSLPKEIWHSEYLSEFTKPEAKIL